MSSQVYCKGRLIPIASGENIETKAKEIITEKFPQYSENVKKFGTTYTDELFDIGYNDYLVINDTLYINDSETLEYDYSPDFCNLYKNTDNSVEYESSFYNGGTCLSEMIEDEWDDMKQKSVWQTNFDTLINDCTCAVDSKANGLCIYYWCNDSKNWKDIKTNIVYNKDDVTRFIIL